MENEGYLYQLDMGMMDGEVALTGVKVAKSSKNHAPLVNGASFANTRYVITHYRKEVP